MARVNIVQQVNTVRGWNIVTLDRNAKGNIKWGSSPGRYLIEWRENGNRKR